MSKFIIIIAVIVILAIVAGVKIYTTRRPLPFQEIIALDKGIAVVNAQKWFMDDLQITYVKDGRKLKKTTFDKNGISILSDLNNGQEYTVEVSRTDLKGKLLYSKVKTKVTPREGGSKYYILVGASIGKTWNFPGLPDRVSLNSNIVMGNRTVYQFDKTEIVNELVTLPVPVTAVIIKECSAYFPRDLDKSKNQIVEWVSLLKQNNIQPILATTVPITEPREHKDPGKQGAIEYFNDFIHQYAKKENLVVLDLEKALRKSDSDRHLKEKFAKPDGTHLVQQAYDEGLDPLITPLLNTKSH